MNCSLAVCSIVFGGDARRFLSGAVQAFFAEVALLAQRNMGKVSIAAQARARSSGTYSLASCGNLGTTHSLPAQDIRNFHIHHIAEAAAASALFPILVRLDRFYTYAGA